MEGTEKITIRIFKSITLVHEAGMVLLEVRDTNKQTTNFINVSKVTYRVFRHFKDKTFDMYPNQVKESFPFYSSTAHALLTIIIVMF